MQVALTLPELLASSTMSLYPIRDLPSMKKHFDIWIKHYGLCQPFREIYSFHITMSYALCRLAFVQSVALACF